MFIIQNSWQFFSFSQNLKFFKISQWNLIFSCKFKLSPLCMNEEKWKKCWVVYVCYRFILEQCALVHEGVGDNAFLRVFLKGFALVFDACKSRSSGSLFIVSVKTGQRYMDHSLFLHCNPLSNKTDQLGFFGGCFYLKIACYLKKQKKCIG